MICGLRTFAVLRRRRILLRNASGPGPSEHRTRKSQKDWKHIHCRRGGEAAETSLADAIVPEHGLHETAPPRERHSQGTMRAAALFCLAPPFSRGLNASAFFVLPSYTFHASHSPNVPPKCRKNRPRHCRSSSRKGMRARVLLPPASSAAAALCRSESFEILSRRDICDQH